MDKIQQIWDVLLDSSQHFVLTNGIECILDIHFYHDMLGGEGGKDI